MNNNYLVDLLKKEIRLDDRKLDEHRKPIKIITNISKNAEGSSHVILGNTEVVVGVKLDVGTPFPDNPDEGTIIVTAELLPLSSPEFEPGPPNEQAVELARVVDRGIRESKALDFKKLNIKTGELVWLVYIDIYTLNDDGNLIDAAALATIAALKEAHFPKLENDKVKYGEFTEKKLPLSKTPITCTFIKVNDKILLDPNMQEEKIMDARLSVAVYEDKIHAMQKGGPKGLTINDINRMIDLAINKSKDLLKLLK